MHRDTESKGGRVSVNAEDLVSNPDKVNELLEVIDESAAST
jgi:hypothetical protein